MERIALCLLDLADVLDGPVEGLLRLFSPARREAVLRYRLNSDRNRTVWAELLARRMVAERSGRDFRDVVIARDRDGRPYCAEGGAGVKLSLSHSGRWAACCVGDVPCGVDVESGGRKVEAGLDIARRFFLPAEYGVLLSLAERGEDWREEFLRFWTLKESALKCLGLREWSGVDCAMLRAGAWVPADFGVAGRNFALPDGAVVGVCGPLAALPETAAILSAETLLKDLP